MIRVSSCSQNKFSVSYGTYYIKDPLDKVVTDRDGSVRHTNWYEAICSFTPLSSSAALRRAQAVRVLKTTACGASAAWTTAAAAAERNFLKAR